MLNSIKPYLAYGLLAMGACMPACQEGEDHAMAAQVRKLEFLVADALEQGADTLVTIGGIQSNHARATAVASRCDLIYLHVCYLTPALVHHSRYRSSDSDLDQ